MGTEHHVCIHWHPSACMHVCATGCRHVSTFYMYICPTWVLSRVFALYCTLWFLTVFVYAYLHKPRQIYMATVPKRVHLQIGSKIWALLPAANFAQPPSRTPLKSDQAEKHNTIHPSPIALPYLPRPIQSTTPCTCRCLRCPAQRQNLGRAQKLRH